VSGSKVRAAAVRPASCGLYSANLTPGHRHCRQSPADATEGNEPKTDRKKSNRRARRRGLGGAAAGKSVATGRWSVGQRRARVRYAATDRLRSRQPARRLPTSSGRPCLSASISLGGRAAPASSECAASGLPRCQHLDRRPISPSCRYRTPEFCTSPVGFRFVPLGRVGRALPTVPVLGSQVRAVRGRHLPA